MRRFIIILLVLLLPIRAWSADRMALPAAHSLAATAIAELHSAMGEMTDMVEMAECPMAHSVADSDGDTPASKSHSACQTCQLCMPLTPRTELSLALVEHKPQAPLVLATVYFTSADRARLAKPPIL